jgi:hypothetical protein
MHHFHVISALAIVLSLSSGSWSRSDRIGGGPTHCDVRTSSEQCRWNGVDNQGCDAFSVRVAAYTTLYSEKMATPQSGFSCGDYRSDKGFECVGPTHVDLITNFDCTQNIPWVPWW